MQNDPNALNFNGTFWQIVTWTDWWNPSRLYSIPPNIATTPSSYFRCAWKKIWNFTAQHAFRKMRVRAKEKYPKLSIDGILHWNCLAFHINVKCTMNEKMSLCPQLMLEDLHRNFGSLWKLRKAVGDGGEMAVMSACKEEKNVSVALRQISNYFSYKMEFGFANHCQRTSLTLISPIFLIHSCPTLFLFHGLRDVKQENLVVCAKFRSSFHVYNNNLYFYFWTIVSQWLPVWWWRELSRIFCTHRFFIFDAVCFFITCLLLARLSPSTKKKYILSH